MKPATQVVIDCSCNFILRMKITADNITRINAKPIIESFTYIIDCMFVNTSTITAAIIIIPIILIYHSSDQVSALLYPPFYDLLAF
jgi:hypothetical protein